MRVLLIAHGDQPKIEGQPRAEYLAKLSGIDLKVIIPDRWFYYGEWRTPQIPKHPTYSYEVCKIMWPWLGLAQCYLYWYPGLEKILHDFNPNIIDIWEEPWGLVSAHVCRLRNKILPETSIISETEQNINKHLPFPFEAFRSYTFKNADYVICRNKEGVDVVRQKGYRGPVEIAPNGVDIHLFHALDREACRRELGISGFTIGYVGRLVEKKGLTDIINALTMYSEGVNCVFVGDGPLRKRLGDKNRIRFIPTMPQEGLPKVMNAIDVLILPSWTTKRWKEQFGRVIIEAGACGTPVIGSDSGAIPEVVREAGLIVPEKNPKALAYAINRLREDPGLCAKLGAIGRKQAEENYSWEQVASRLRTIYAKLLQ